MLLHMQLGLTEKGRITDNKIQMPIIWAWDVYVGQVCVHNQTWHNYLTLMEGEGHSILLFTFCQVKKIYTCV